MTTLPSTIGPSPTLPVMVASIKNPWSLVDSLLPPPQPDSDRSKHSAEGQNPYVYAIRKTFQPWRSVQEVRSCFELRFPRARSQIVVMSYPELYPYFVSAGRKAG